MSLSRRELLKWGGATCAAGLMARIPGVDAATRPIAWRNWSGAQSSLPAQRFAPASEDELATWLRQVSGEVRAVGSGHSFSALVPTDGSIVSLSRLSGLISHDPASLQAEFWAGTPMSQMGEPLKQVGQGLVNMADVDYQTLAGAIATSTHGTGPRFGSYSSYVTGLRLLTADGQMLDCDADNHPDVFNAARCSLGALGLITRVRMQNRKAFRLHSRQWVQDTDELLEQLPELIHKHDHFELNAITHADVSVALAMDETDNPKTITKESGGDGSKVKLLQLVHQQYRNWPRMRAGMLNFIARHLLDFPDAIDDSFRVFANVRDQRFHEMEYEVPAEAGAACLREVLAKIRDSKVDTFFPVEFRHVKADDVTLSMFQGRDSCAISVHQFDTMDYHNVFAQIEPIFWKYDGRPHWGKLHSLNARQLAPLYPKWKEFLGVRQALDPHGRFLNAHLRSLFGIA